MKFTKPHYQILKDKIITMLEATSNTAPALQKVYNDKGLSNTRLCFDVFYAAKIKIGDGKGLSSNCGIEGDYNDNHIETAVKKVLTELGAKL